MIHSSILNVHNTLLFLEVSGQSSRGIKYLDSRPNSRAGGFDLKTSVFLRIPVQVKASYALL